MASKETKALKSYSRLCELNLEPGVKPIERGQSRKYKAWKVKGLNLATSTSEVRNLKVEILTSAPGDLRTGPGPQCAHHTLTAKLSTPFQTDPNVHRAVAHETTFLLPSSRLSIYPGSTSQSTFP